MLAFLERKMFVHRKYDTINTKDVQNVVLQSVKNIKMLILELNLLKICQYMSLFL